MGSELWGEHSQQLEGHRALQMNWSQKHWGAAQGHHRRLAIPAGLVTLPNTQAVTGILLRAAHPGSWGSPGCAEHGAHTDAALPC